MIGVLFAHDFTQDGKTTIMETLKSAPQREKRLQDRIEKLEDHNQQLERKLRHYQKLATLGTTAAMLAHEFNNIMTPIMGYGNYALGRKDPEMMVKALETTMEQAEAVQAMSQRILDMAADVPPSIQPVSLVEIVDKSARALCRELDKDGIELITDVEADLRVLADANQLQLVFVNLFINARDALAGRSGRISVSAQVDDDKIVMQFSDNGPGIPLDVVDHIFDPHFTTKNGEVGSGGSGLGLALCREIIEEHRGTIELESTSRSGTVFVISLPSAL